MAKMKELSITMEEAALAWLADRTGYSVEELWAELTSMREEFLEDGEPIEDVWPFFYGVAMEHDF